MHAAEQGALRCQVANSWTRPDGTLNPGCLLCMLKFYFPALHACRRYWRWCSAGSCAEGPTFAR